MKHRPYQTIEFFGAWGAIYGMILGGLCGTIVAPIIATILGIIFGLMLGIALGIVVGIVVALTNAIFYRTPYDLINYRRRYTLLIGAGVGIGAPLLLMLGMYEAVWESFSPLDYPLHLSAILGTAFWGGLSSACAASWYSDWYTSSISKKRKDVGIENALVQKFGILLRFANKMVDFDRKSIVFLLLVFGALTCYDIYVTPMNYRSLARFIQVLSVNLLLVIGTMAVCVITAGYLTHFFNRVLLLEYNLFQSLQQLQRFVRITVCILLVMIGGMFVLQHNYYSPLDQPLSSVGILVLVSFFAGWRMTDGFGEWYFREEKVKSKPKVEFASDVS